LPLACTLGSADGQARLDRWQVLHTSAAPVARMVGGALEVRYPSGPGVRQELEVLAAAERSCCGFVTWEVSDERGQPVLRVRAPSGAPDTLAPIAALFGPA
jgi:hypothetical protein